MNRHTKNVCKNNDDKKERRKKGSKKKGKENGISMPNQVWVGFVCVSNFRSIHSPQA